MPRGVSKTPKAGKSSRRKPGAVQEMSDAEYEAIIGEIPAKLASITDEECDLLGAELEEMSSYYGAISEESGSSSGSVDQLMDDYLTAYDAEEAARGASAIPSELSASSSSSSSSSHPVMPSITSNPLIIVDYGTNPGVVTSQVPVPVGSDGSVSNPDLVVDQVAGSIVVVEPVTDPSFVANEGSGQGQVSLPAELARTDAIPSLVVNRGPDLVGSNLDVGRVVIPPPPVGGSTGARSGGGSRVNFDSSVPTPRPVPTYHQIQQSNLTHSVTR